MKSIERKVLVQNLPTEKESQTFRYKNSKRKTFLDDQAYAEKIKQNISSRRNLSKEETHFPVTWKLANKTRQPLHEVHIHHLTNVQMQDKEEREFDENEKKIGNLRQKLQELYSHYQSQSKQLRELKSKVAGTQRLKKQNEILSSQIGRIRNMVKQALLMREKSKISQ